MTKPATTAATFNAIDVREAVLFLTNDADFYGQTRHVRENLAKHLAAGKWDADKAAKVYGVCISNAQKSASWGIVYGAWKLAKVDREQAARELVESYAEEISGIAADLIGPEFLAIEVADFAHDVYGNPTAMHIVGTSTETGGFVKRLSASWKVRRAQVGYGDYTDGCADGAKKCGIKLDRYTRHMLTGSRSEDSILVIYKRNELTAI